MSADESNRIEGRWVTYCQCLRQSRSPYRQYCSPTLLHNLLPFGRNLGRCEISNYLPLGLAALVALAPSEAAVSSVLSSRLLTQAVEVFVLELVLGSVSSSRLAELVMAVRSIWPVLMLVASVVSLPVAQVSLLVHFVCRWLDVTVSLSSRGFKL